MIFTKEFQAAKLRAEKKIKAGKIVFGDPDLILFNQWGEVLEALNNAKKKCSDCVGRGTISENCYRCSGTGKVSADCGWCDGAGSTKDACECQTSVDMVEKFIEEF